MDLKTFCRDLPKIVCKHCKLLKKFLGTYNNCSYLLFQELHAHLNGSLSRSTMLHLKRFYADSGLEDKTNAFFDEFQIGAGDCRNLSELVYHTQIIILEYIFLI